MTPDIACRVAENAPAMLMYLDADLRVRFANQHCYELLGRAPREILGRLLAELVDERTLKYALDHIAEVDRGPGAKRDYVLRDRDGMRKYLQIHAVADRDREGRCIGEFASTADRAAQRTAEERLRHALAGARAGIWEWDLGTNHVYYSPEFSALLGYPAPGFAAGFSFFAAIHPEDHDDAFDALAGAIEDGSTFDREFRMLGADGEYRWLRGVGHALRDADKDVPARFIGTARDVSARKRAEAELREARRLVDATLEACIGVSRELDERRRLDRVRRELFSAANHEVRTPLASIVAALELLRDGAGERSGQTRDSFLELALRNAEQLARVVEQWLDLERSSAAAAERGVRIECEVDRAIEVRADPERLEQALGHVVANALERSPKGGLVRIQGGVRGETAVLLVEDEGGDVFSATSIGLSACRAILERQGATLEVANRASRGAAFHLELPCR